MINGGFLDPQLVLRWGGWLGSHQDSWQSHLLPLVGTPQAPCSSTNATISTLVYTLHYTLETLHCSALPSTRTMMGTLQSTLRQCFAIYQRRKSEHAPTVIRLEHSVHRRQQYGTVSQCCIGKRQLPDGPELPSRW